MKYLYHVIKRLGIQNKSHMIYIPNDMVKMLKLNKGDEVKVSLVEIENKKVIIVEGVS